MNAIELIINLLSSVIAVEYIHHGFEKKYQGWRRYLCFVAGCAAYFFIVAALGLLTDFEGLLSVLYGIVLVLYGLAALKGSFHNILFLSLSWILVALLGTSSVYGAVGFFTECNPSEWIAAVPGRYLYASVAAATVKFILGRIVLRLYVRKKDPSEKVDWLSSGGLLLFLVTGLLLFRMELLETTQKQRYGSLSVLLLVQFLSVLFLERMHQKSVEAQNQKLELEFRLKLFEEMEKSGKENRRNLYRITREIGRWKHDMDGKLSILCNLLKKQHYEEAWKELEKTCGEFLRYPELPQETGNAGLDAALIKAVAQCREEDIRFFYVILGSPKRIDATAMGNLMWNLFQNGIEACLAQDQNRVMEVTLRENSSATEIRIENSIGKSVLETNPELRSGKKDSDLHGFGMESIFAVIEAYQGSYVCFEEDGRFIQEIRLQHPEPPAVTDYDEK